MLSTKQYTVKVDDTVIIENLDLEFKSGIHVVMGPNGVGKSTLAHALMGNPNYDTDGTIELKGTDISDLETHERAQQGMFLSFQHPTPIAGLSNFQLVKQVLDQQQGIASDVSQITTNLVKFKNLASKFNLPEQWDKKHLNVEASGGEKKKNEIIQMLMFEPDVAILDEPDSGLDIDAINTLAELLLQYSVDNPDKCLIVITHYEKLINAINPSSVTVLGKNGATCQPGKQLAQAVFENGFKEYV